MLIFIDDSLFSEEGTEAVGIGVVGGRGEVISRFVVFRVPDAQEGHHGIEDEVIGEEIVFVIFQRFQGVRVIFDVRVRESHIEGNPGHGPGEDGGIVV